MFKLNICGKCEDVRLQILLVWFIMCLGGASSFWPLGFGLTDNAFFSEPWIEPIEREWVGDLLWYEFIVLMQGPLLLDADMVAKLSACVARVTAVEQNWTVHIEQLMRSNHLINRYQ